jgi:putative phosphoribosyl transferase
MFQDRADAGRMLASRLMHLQSARPVILGLPRGGVVVAAEVARALQASLGVLMVRKLGAPGQPELAIGAVAEAGGQPLVWVNHDLVYALGVDEGYLRAEIDYQLREVRERRMRFGQSQAPELDGRTVVVIDDGIATGATMRAALAALRQAKPARLVLAVPVAPPDTIELLRREVDEIVCLASPANFTAVGRFYRNFEQTRDEEVVALLEHATAEGMA